MTKIRIMSDLHYEYSPFELDYYGEDILILAGDITPAKNQMVTIIESYLKKNKNTFLLLVLGNHDYYNSSIEETDEFYKSLVLDRFYFLQNNSVVLHGLCFYGTTLWSDIYPIKTQVVEKIGDYRSIVNLTPDLVLSMFEKNVALLEEHLFHHPSSIVITHYLPSFKSVAKQYILSTINPAFASNLDYLVKKSKMWIHGHTHCSMNYFLENCHVICNPRGLPDENGMFRSDYIVDV